MGVTRRPPGNTLSPGNIFPQRNKVTRWPPVTPPLRTATSLFSLLSPVSGWCQGPVCFGFGVSFSSLLLYRYTVEKGPRERLGDALWQFPMAKWTLELGRVHRYGMDSPYLCMTDVVCDTPRFCLSQTRVLPLHRTLPLSLSLSYLYDNTQGDDFSKRSPIPFQRVPAFLWYPSGIWYPIPPI